MIHWLKRKTASLCGRLRKRLIDDITSLHRFYSTRAASGGLMLIAVWEAIPDSMRVFLPRSFLTLVACSALVLVLVGRGIRQNIPHTDQNGRAS